MLIFIQGALLCFIRWLDNLCHPAALEDWHSSMLTQYPSCIEYLSKIQDAINRLDLDAVEQLALNPSIPSRT